MTLFFTWDRRSQSHECAGKLSSTSFLLNLHKLGTGALQGGYRIVARFGIWNFIQVKGACEGSQYGPATFL